MSFDKNACIKEIQDTIDSLTIFEIFANTAFLDAQDLGLHGFKRESRLADTNYGNIKKYLQSEIRDIFGVKILPKTSGTPFSYKGGIEGFLEAYSEELWFVYTTLHTHANKLVSPLLMRHLAKPLYEQAEKTKCEYVETCRELERWELIKEHGTALHDLYRTQNTAETIHDKTESLENDTGYDF